MKVALIEGGASPEKEISKQSSQAVAKVLSSKNMDHFVCQADDQMFDVLKKEKPDVAFLATHGIYGEDGILQSCLEFLKIPYTGSGVLASAICMDKFFFKQLLVKNKILTPDFNLVASSSEAPFPYPFVLKASHGGSTLGTYIVKNEKEFKEAYSSCAKLGRHVFAETYLPDCLEVNQSFLGDEVLPAVSVVSETGFYDYHSKYKSLKTKYQAPPDLPPMVLENISQVSRKIFKLVGLRGYGRVDYLIDSSHKIWVLEVNSLPGLTEKSLLPKACEAKGISFEDMVLKIIKLARLDYNG